jgi:hypothetical protein
MKYFLLAGCLLSLAGVACAQTTTATPPAAQPGTTQVPATITGGYDTVGADRGRPVVLIAAALKVPDQVFRDAFSHVKPAGPGQQPQEDQVRKNKQALMSALSPYGVTDDRLNEVSNYYRYSKSRGEMWRTTPAVVLATVSNGVVTGFTITNAGSGYSSPPTISVPGANVSATAILSYGTDFATNGSIKEITIAAPPAP